jgi:hypothetical protein
MKSFARAIVVPALAAFCAACAVVRPYTSDTPAFHICSVKREDKLLAIDGQSRLVEARGINSQATRNSGKFTGLGGIDKWRYEARFLPPEMQGEEYIVVFDAKGPEPVFAEPLTLKFEYMYAKGLEVHYSEKAYENLPRGRHKYTWKNLGTQNVDNGDIVGWRASLHYKGTEVDSMHSALWRPWGKVVLDE